jgi:hypothetical protein
MLNTIIHPKVSVGVIVMSPDNKLLLSKRKVTYIGHSRTAGSLVCLAETWSSSKRSRTAANVNSRKKLVYA